MRALMALGRAGGRALGRARGGAGAARARGGAGAGMAPGGEAPGGVRVRVDEGASTMTIALQVGGRPRNMNRERAEPCSKALARIGKSAAPPRTRGAGKKAGPPAAAAETVAVCLRDAQGREVPGETPNEEAWVEGGTLSLGGDVLRIEKNSPTVASLEAERRPVVGFELRPPFSVVFGEPELCLWNWERQAALEKGPAAWESTGGTGHAYVPAEADAGKRLRVTCTPRGQAPPGASPGVLREGEPVAVAMDGVVEPSSEGKPWDGRREGRWARPAAAGTCRVMTYNLLAEMYSSSETAKTKLFRYVLPENLDWDYRKQLQLQEVLGAQADVLCFQEVDTKAFERFWKPRLAEAGFSGFFGKKSSEASEGQATFVRDSKFRIAAARTLPLRDAFTEPLGAALAAAGPFLEAVPNIRDALEKLGTVASLVRLEPVSGGDQCPMCVVNTHLYFHPGASSIRTLQLYAILKEAEAWLVGSAAAGEVRPAVLFCGDLNSEPDTAAIELLQTGQVGRDHYEWQTAREFTFRRRGEKEAAAQPAGGGGPAASVPGPVLASPFGLASADRLLSPYTNFVQGYIATLDYIFFEVGRLRLEALMPLPTVEQIQNEEVVSAADIPKRGALPSKRYPSDHVAIVADLAVARQGDAPCPATAASRLPWPPPVRDASRAPEERKLRPVMPLPASKYNVRKAVAALRRGGVVALPSDTIYGVAACAASSEGVRRVYDCKRRSANVPLSICVQDIASVAAYGDTDHLPPGLLEALLPGPVTLLLRRLEEAPLDPSLNPGTRAIGIRIPACEFLCAVASAHGGALALTSANVSGSSSTKSVWEFREIWDACEHVFDGGELDANDIAGSTVVDLSSPGSFKVLRAGCAEAQTTEILQGFGLGPAAQGG